MIEETEIETVQTEVSETAGKPESSWVMPKILAFCCNWCSYAGIENAGTMHLEYPPTVRMVKVMCAGRIHPELILEAFARGADGVLVASCKVGDCHYRWGNDMAGQRFGEMGSLLAGIGIDPKRFCTVHLWAYDGKRFAETVKEFTGELLKLGPNPVNLIAPENTP
jgi:F420-non-reducing hydrogenase iron-sulfur subunit